MSCFNFNCFSSPAGASRTNKEPGVSPASLETGPTISGGADPTHRASSALQHASSAVIERIRSPPTADVMHGASSAHISSLDHAESTVILHVLDSRSQLKNAVIQARGLELSLFALDDGGLRVVDAQDYAPATAREMMLAAESLRSSRHGESCRQTSHAGNGQPSAFTTESLYLRVIHASPSLLTSLNVPSISAYADIFAASVKKAAMVDNGLLSTILDGSAFAALRGRIRSHEYDFPTSLFIRNSRTSAFQGMKIRVESGMWSGLPVVIVKHQPRLDNNLPSNNPMMPLLDGEASLRMQTPPDVKPSIQGPGGSNLSKATPPPESLIASHVASELPALLTLITMDGDVLYQNGCSREFYGSLMGRRVRTRTSIPAVDDHDLGFWSDSLGRLLAASQPEEGDLSFDPLQPQLISPVILEILNAVEAEGEWRGLVELVQPISGPFRQRKPKEEQAMANFVNKSPPLPLGGLAEEPLLVGAVSGGGPVTGDNQNSFVYNSSPDFQTGVPGGSRGSIDIDTLFASMHSGFQNPQAAQDSAKPSQDSPKPSMKEELMASDLSLDVNLDPPEISSKSFPRRSVKRQPSFTVKKPPTMIMSLLNSSGGGFGGLLSRPSSSNQDRPASGVVDGSSNSVLGGSSGPSVDEHGTHHSQRPLPEDMLKSLQAPVGAPLSILRSQSTEPPPCPFSQLSRGLSLSKSPSYQPNTIDEVDETDEPSSDQRRPNLPNLPNLAAGSNRGSGGSVPAVHTFVSGRRLSISMMTAFGTSMLAGDKEQATVWHEMVAGRIPHPSGSGSAVVLMQSDVTERTRLEASIVELSEAQCRMLSSVFPRHIIEFLSLIKMESIPAHIAEVARTHEDVTIMFMDIVGFTSMSKEVNANVVMTLLNTLFTMFDKLAGAHKVHKVETAGDCYIVAGGILETAETDGFSDLTEHHDPVQSARRVYAFARDMLRCSKEVKMPHNGETVTIRIGIHTGNCVSGLIGTRLPKFSIFGDTMNTASRMESTCAPGLIQISKPTWDLLQASQNEPRVNDEWRATGGVEVKGKGILETFIWTPSEDFLRSPVNPAAFAKIVEAKRNPRNPMTSLVSNMMSSSRLAGASSPSSSSRDDRHNGLVIMGTRGTSRDFSSSHLRISSSDLSGVQAESQVDPIRGRVPDSPLRSEQRGRTHSSHGPLHTTESRPHICVEGPRTLPSSLEPSMLHSGSIVKGSSAHGNEIGISLALIQMCQQSLRQASTRGANSPSNSARLPSASQYRNQSQSGMIKRGSKSGPHATDRGRSEDFAWVGMQVKVEGGLQSQDLIAREGSRVQGHRDSDRKVKKDSCSYSG